MTEVELVPRNIPVTQPIISASWMITSEIQAMTAMAQM